MLTLSYVQQSLAKQTLQATYSKITSQRRHGGCNQLLVDTLIDLRCPLFGEMCVQISSKSLSLGCCLGTCTRVLRMCQLQRAFDWSVDRTRIIQLLFLIFSQFILCFNLIKSHTWSKAICDNSSVHLFDQISCNFIPLHKGKCLLLFLL